MIGYSLVAAVSMALASQVSKHESHGEELLGTSYHLRFEASDQAPVGIEATVLAEVERLRQVFDRYDETSELLSLKPGEATAVSPALADAVARCRSWRIKTGGAFDPAAAHLDQLWRAAEARGERPSQRELELAVYGVRTQRWRCDAGVLTATSIETSLDGLAKGLILDAASKSAREAGATQLLFDIGGDVLAYGEAVTVQIADPLRQADNAEPLVAIRLQDAAVATSGGYLRGYTIDGEHLGHVLDPRSGQPANHVIQATVVAKHAVDADALATALMVMPIDRALDLVQKREGTECLIVTPTGERFASAGWNALIVKDHAAVEASAPGSAPWPNHKAVAVAFKLQRPGRGDKGGGQSYRRPYVGIWVETPSGEPVRTLALWIGRERWLRDLRRWYRHHRDERGLIDAVTMPTRKPGEYRLVWDGLDDAGQALPLGPYRIKVEVAREHGTYQLVTLDIDTSLEHAVIEGDSNAELAACQAEFGPKRAQ